MFLEFQPIVYGGHSSCHLTQRHALLMFTMVTMVSGNLIVMGAQAQDFHKYASHRSYRMKTLSLLYYTSRVSLCVVIAGVYRTTVYRILSLLRYVQDTLTSAFAGACSGSGEDEVSEQFIAAGQPLLTKADAEQPTPAQYFSTAQAAAKPTYRGARRNSSFKILRVQARARIVRLLLQEKFPALPTK